MSYGVMFTQGCMSIGPSLTSIPQQKHKKQAACAESRQNGPFYAALGFSQGANVAAALLAKQVPCIEDDVAGACSDGGNYYKPPRKEKVAVNVRNV